MTQNPYASPAGFPGELAGPERTSALAVSSLVVSILGLIACCLPGPGLIGFILGVAALFAIGASHGRLGGRGFAFAGVVIGLLATVLSVGVWVGGAQYWSGSLAGPATRFLTAVEQGDHATARSMMSPSAPPLTDEQLADFSRAVQDANGGVIGVPRGLREMAGAYSRARNAAAGNLPGALGQQGTPLPMPAEYDRGTATAVFFLEERGGASLDGQIMNVAVVSAQGTAVWLIEPAPPPAPRPPPQQPEGTPDDAARGAGERAPDDDE